MKQTMESLQCTGIGTSKGNEQLDQTPFYPTDLADTADAELSTLRK
jgi:hypothetical protein